MNSEMEYRPLTLGSGTRDVWQSAVREVPCDSLGAVQTGERQRIPAYT